MGPRRWPRTAPWDGRASVSGLLLAGSFVLFILAITRTTVANAVVLQSAAPLVSAVLGRVFLKERWRRRLSRPFSLALPEWR